MLCPAFDRLRPIVQSGCSAARSCDLLTEQVVTVGRCLATSGKAFLVDVLQEFHTYMVLSSVTSARARVFNG